MQFRPYPFLDHVPKSSGNLFPFSAVLKAGRWMGSCDVLLSTCLDTLFDIILPCSHCVFNCFCFLADWYDATCGDDDAAAAAVRAVSWQEEERERKRASGSGGGGGGKKKKNKK